MQRYGLPIVLAVVIGLAFIGLRSLGGDDEPELPIDLEPISVRHSIESGLIFKLVNNSQNAFVGDVRVQVVQANSSVTTSVRIEVAAFGVAEGEVNGDWAAGAGSPAIQLLLDPQNNLPDTEDGNNSVTLICSEPDASCEILN